MKRFLSLLSLVFPLALAAKSPNVVFFLVDDMGWRDVACFGSSFYETPNIDRFAEGGCPFYERLRGLPCLLADACEHHDWYVSGASGTNRLALGPA